MFETKPKQKDIELLETMHRSLAQGKWDGDRDSWPKPIDDKLWQLIVSDKHSCNNSLPGHRGCPFQKRAQSWIKTMSSLLTTLSSWQTQI